MRKTSLIFTILIMMTITSESSFANFGFLRVQSNDLFTNTYSRSPRIEAQASRQRVSNPSGGVQNPGRTVPAGATQDPQGNRAINCRNPQGDFACMACNCYNEAAHRYDDQIAVSKVVMTRVQLSEFPNTVCGVVKQRLQFSWYNQLRSRRTVPANDSCMKAATEALQFRGYFADHYHANYVRPRWRRNMTPVAQVGVHIYYSRFDSSDFNRRGGTTTVAGL